jgi:hypothetical protein
VRKKRSWRRRKKRRRIRRRRKHGLNLICNIEDRAQWWAVVPTAMNRRVSLGEFLVEWAAVDFWGTILVHGVFYTFRAYYVPPILTSSIY